MIEHDDAVIRTDPKDTTPTYNTEKIHGSAPQSATPLILESVKEASKEYTDVPHYKQLCEEHAKKVEKFLQAYFLKPVLIKLVIKHNVLSIKTKDNAVYFTINGFPMGYYYSTDKWYLGFGPELPESKAFMDDLLKAGIIAEDGKANLTYGWD